MSIAKHAIQQAIANPGRLGAVAARTNLILEHVTKRELVAELQAQGIDFTLRRATNVIHLPGTDSRIVLVGLSKGRYAVAGLNLAWYAFDESGNHPIVADELMYLQAQVRP